MPFVSKRQGKPVSKGRVLSSSAAVLLASLLTTAAAAQTAAPNPERRGAGIAPALAGEARDSFLPPLPFDIDARRSLFVTEKAALKAFTLFDVMKLLAADAADKGDATATAERLFNDWWAQAAKPPCKDTVNGFSYVCPRPESNQTTVEAFGTGAGSYILIAAVNRLDLAPRDWSNCGEQRLVFARMAGEDATPIAGNRNLVIFEAAVPNPGEGSSGCEGIADFWAGLSEPDLSAEERGSRLRSFFLTGWGDPAIPVVSLDNYGFHIAETLDEPTLTPPLGQIRSNQFMGGSWLLREFRPRAVAGYPEIAIAPQNLAANPEPLLFSARPGDPFEELARKLGNEIVAGMSDLTVPDINLFSFASSLDINTADGHSQSPKGSFATEFANDSGTGIVREAINNAPANLKRDLTPKQIVARIQAMSCGGCHQSSNDADIGLDDPWPTTAVPEKEVFGFIHVNETLADSSQAVDSFDISPALKGVFLPHRLAFFMNTFFNRN